MRRRASNLWMAASLLLCFAAAALWVRSDYVGDVVTRVTPNGLLQVQSAGGRFAVRSGGPVLLQRGRWYWDPWSGEIDIFPRSWTTDRWWERDGFGYDESRWRTADGRLAGLDYRVSFPAWLPVAMFALTPARKAWSRLLRYRRSRRRGYCIQCGYDLRATPGRCPECGTAPADATCAKTAKQAGPSKRDRFNIRDGETVMKPGPFYLPGPFSLPDRRERR